MDPLQMREKLYRIMTWCTAIFAVLCCILCVVYFQNITFFETHGKIGTLAQQEQQALEQENSRRLLAKKNIAVTIADKPQGMLAVPLQGKVEESQVSVREEFVQNKLVITIKEAAACIKEGTELVSDSAYMNGISIYQQKNDLILELYCNAMYAYQCQIDNQTLSFTFLDPAAVYEKSVVIYVPQGQKDRFTSEDWQKSIKELATQNKCKIFLCSELQEDYTEEDVAAFAEGIVLRDETRCLPAKLEPLGPGESLVTVCEGKYHQVRRMMASRNMTVLYLERREEGGLTLGDLPRGQVRELTAQEIQSLEA